MLGAQTFAAGHHGNDHTHMTSWSQREAQRSVGVHQEASWKRQHPKKTRGGQTEDGGGGRCRFQCEEGEGTEDLRWEGSARLGFSTTGGHRGSVWGGHRMKT